VRLLAPESSRDIHVDPAQAAVDMTLEVVAARNPAVACAVD